MLRATMILLTMAAFGGCFGGAGIPVALEVDEEIFVGFFVGDQIERVGRVDLKSA